MLSVMALAWAYVRWGALPVATGVLYGVKPVIIAIVLQAMWGLARTAVRGPLLAGAFVVAAALALAGVHELLVLFGVGGVAALVAPRRRAVAGAVAALAWATPARVMAATGAAGGGGLRPARAGVLQSCARPSRAAAPLPGALPA